MLAVVRGRFCKVTRAPGTSPLFLLNPGRLDDRPPFLNFSLVPDAQRLGRVLQARENLLAQVGKPRVNLGIRQRGHYRCVELGNDVFGRVLAGTHNACQRGK